MRVTRRRGLVAAAAGGASATVGETLLDAWERVQAETLLEEVDGLGEVLLRKGARRDADALLCLIPVRHRGHVGGGEGAGGAGGRNLAARETPHFGRVERPERPAPSPRPSCSPRGSESRGCPPRSPRAPPSPLPFHPFASPPAPPPLGDGVGDGPCVGARARQRRAPLDRVAPTPLPPLREVGPSRGRLELVLRRARCRRARPGASWARASGPCERADERAGSPTRRHSRPATDRGLRSGAARVRPLEATNNAPLVRPRLVCPTPRRRSSRSWTRIGVRSCSGCTATRS